MTVQLNHTIVWSRDKASSAGFFAEMLGLPAPKRFFHFLVIELENGVSLDFSDDTDEPIVVQHYAFLVGEPEFDQILGRIQAKGVDHWADPALTKPGEINRHDGGRGVYFRHPEGHLLEAITRPYGSGGA